MNKSKSLDSEIIDGMASDVSSIHSRVQKPINRGFLKPFVYVISSIKVALYSPPENKTSDRDYNPKGYPPIGGSF
jgi:hypothetical protein